MARFRVVLTDHRFPDLGPMREVLEAGEAELIDAQASTAEAVADATAEADAVLNVRAPVTELAIGRMRRCRLITRLGIGVDTVDVAAATRRGIPVANVPNYCIDEVADHALTLMLAWARRLSAFVDAAHRGVFEPGRIDVAAPPRLRGQTLGLVGFGRIGRAVALRAGAFGLRTIVFDPYVTAEVVAREGLTLVDLETLLGSADYVSLHCALTDETRGLMNDAAFARMKPTALLVNVARGGIIERAALLAALRTGRIAGAALDVFDVEPLVAGDPLLDAPNLLATPHVAWYSSGSLAELPVLGAQETVRVLHGEVPRNVVNRQALGAR